MIGGVEMYQNMDCALLGYRMLEFATRYTVYNAAGEAITNPRLINAEHINIGICVPYGGSIKITMDSNHDLKFVVPTGCTNLIVISATETRRIDIFRDYIAIVNTISTENGRIVKTPLIE